MRKMDNNRLETANLSAAAAPHNALRVHRGALGQVLQRYLSQQQPQQEYSLVHLEQLWQKAAELDPAIGLHLFAEFTPAERHVLLHVALFSSNLGEALQYWQRYARLGSDMEQVQVIREGECLAIELVIDAPDELRRCLVEHYAVMASHVLCEGAGIALHTLRCEFQHPRPAYHAQYAQWLGRPAHFDAPHNRIYLDPACLALPMRDHQPVLLELLCEGLDRRMARLQQLNGWAAKVAAQVRKDLQRRRPPSLEAAADALHQSPRTLRRRLQEQGLGFREVLDSVRCELEQSLQLQGMNSSQIAEHLGYADSAAYLHARKRWQPDEQ